MWEVCSERKFMGHQGERGCAGCQGLAGARLPCAFRLQLDHCGAVKAKGCSLHCPKSGQLFFHDSQWSLLGKHFLPGVAVATKFHPRGKER